MAEVPGVCVKHFLLQGIVVISSLFCRLDQSCFNQNFDMV